MAEDANLATQEKPIPTPRRKSFYIGGSVLFFLLIIIVIILFKPHTSSQLESCQVAKQGNPLVDNVTMVQDTYVGQFHGTLQKIEKKNDNNLGITLVSLDGKQSHDFTVDTNNASFFDAVEKKPIGVADFQEGQKVVMTFNCFKKTNSFKIISVGKTNL